MCSSNLLNSGATYSICHMVAETISVKCTEHSYQPSSSDVRIQHDKNILLVAF